MAVEDLMRLLTEDQIEYFMGLAIQEAEKGLAEGGIPIGSVLAEASDGRCWHTYAGHNQRVQKSDPILHAEMDCLKNAGRLRSDVYQESVLFSTLSPCDMCSGAVLLYKIPIVVIGENETFRGPEAYLMSMGVKLIRMNDSRCIKLMRDFIKKNPKLWNEDIGV
ncbi:MAG: cytosine deaminase [Parcubacteria group bacterium Gr01-1014_3]|nr:MAG: cytosine deaminase [Parcubacteria group bacterium Gr01-1014_3]